MVDLFGSERELDDPACFGIFPARPPFVIRAELVQAFPDDRAEVASLAHRVGVRRRLHGHAERRLHDEFALGDNRPLEAPDVLKRRAGDGRDILC